MMLPWTVPSDDVARFLLNRRKRYERGDAEPIRLNRRFRRAAEGPGRSSR